MQTDIPIEELDAALDALVEELLNDGGALGPPVDAIGLATALGIRVAWDDRQGERARIVRLGAGGDLRPAPSILLRPDPRPERLQWAVAHEIGEAHAHRLFARLGIDVRTAASGARENAANRLASRLLAPTEWLRSHARACEWDLAELKQIFSTASHELLARRMLDPRMAESMVVVTVFDQNRLTFRRASNALRGRTPPLCEAEKCCQERTHGTGLPSEVEWGMNRVRSWPVHEDGWKREILRWESQEMDC